MDAAGALAMLEGVEDLWVAKGKKTIHLKLGATERPDEDEILGLILGRSGTLRAPAIRTGTRMVVGFNPDILGETLL